MSNDVFVIVEHRDGTVAETAHELLGLARELAAAAGGQAVALVAAADAAPLTSQLGAADRILAVEDPALADFTPSAYQSAIAPLVRDRAPLLVLVPNTGSGMDVAAGLSVTCGLPLAAYATRLAYEQGGLTVTSQLYAGRIEARVRFADGRGICTVAAGAYPAAAGQASGSPSVERVAAGQIDGRVRFVKLMRPEAGDVDITRESVLVSIGRGIGDQASIPMVEELAKALGGAVSSSRPIADAGWLPRSRQVGKSGLKVKPKLYLALGISGAPEHLEGMRDAELIVAVNTDPRAAIFGVAHYGAVVDLLDLVPALTARLSG
jgi:electron transfer flavoprotein alpha subunit